MNINVKEFEEASKPLVKFLNDNCHPHVVVIVETNGAKLSEDLAYVKIEEYIKD